MCNIYDDLNLLALIIQIAGTYIMFKNSPDNKSNIAQTGTFGAGDYKTPKKKNKLLNNGFFILGIGFIIQFISMILKMILG